MMDCGLCGIFEARYKIFVFEVYHCAPKKSWQNSMRHLGDELWSCLADLTAQNKPEPCRICKEVSMETKVKNTVPARILFITMSITLVHLVSQYQGNLLTSLLMPPRAIQMDTIDRLMQSVEQYNLRLLVYEGGPAHVFLTDKKTALLAERGHLVSD